jgi:hypothetical protein
LYNLNPAIANPEGQRKSEVQDLGIKKYGVNSEQNAKNEPEMNCNVMRNTA